MIDSIKIAAASTRVSQDVRENGRHLRELMTQASEAGARLIHFPEGALSGYVKAQILDWKQVDWCALRAELDATADHARQLHLWTVFGCNHRLTPPNRPHNSLYVVSDEGALIGRYDKRFCSNTEINDWYSPGFAPLIFEVDGFKFGTILCIEIFFPELFAEYERLRVDCVLFSTSSSSPTTTNLACAHAAVNNYWLSISQWSQDDGDTAGLIGPDGKFLARSSADGSASMALGALNRADPSYDIPLNKARPWRAKAKQGEIYEARRVNDPQSRERTSFLIP